MTDDEFTPDQDDPEMSVIRVGCWYASGPLRGFEDGWEVWHKTGEDNFVFYPESADAMIELLTKLKARRTGKFRPLKGGL